MIVSARVSQFVFIIGSFFVIALSLSSSGFIRYCVNLHTGKPSDARLSHMQNWTGPTMFGLADHGCCSFVLKKTVHADMFYLSEQKFATVVN